MGSDHWHIVAELDTGRYEILSEQGGPNPSLIDTIYLPVSFPWSEDPEILRLYPEAVAGQERSSGQETHYSARREDSGPNDVLWEVEVEIWEYPSNIFNTAALSVSDSISYAHWDAEDLLDAVSD